MGRWQGPGGYAHVLRVGLPLLAGMAAITVMELTDRLFLGWYSQDALAAVIPSGCTFYLLTCFFLGTVSYVGVLIAQNVGAGRPGAIGAVLWQGIAFSLLSVFPLCALALAAGPIFALMDHPPEVQRLEAVYFRVLMFGAGFAVLETCLAAFYSGRGLTRTVMLVNCGGMLLNVPLDYLLIFGRWGLPPLGTAGSALATAASWAVMAVIFAGRIFTRENQRRFGVFGDWRPNGPLFFKLVRLGAPGGAQIFLDVFAAAFFIALTGRIGKAELTATSLVFAANSPAFVPLLGLSSGLAVVVGQAMGAGRPQVARRAAGSALRLMAVYIAVTATLFLTLPEWIAGLFGPRDDSPDFAAAVALCRPLFAWMALLGCMDIVTKTAFGVLRGAGDTRFLMLSAGVLSFSVLVVPASVALLWYHAGLLVLWEFFVLYTGMFAGVLWMRYRSGVWERLRLVEPAAAVASPPGGYDA